MKFLCQIVGPDMGPGPEVVVDAGGFASAARVHVSTDGPRVALLTREVHVRVRRFDGRRGRPWRHFVVTVELKAEERSWKNPA